MVDLKKLTLAYFTPPSNYFWQWSDNGEAIEHPDKFTICYREDFVPILKDLAQEGLPNLGAILLVLAACRGEDKSATILSSISELCHIGFEKLGFNDDLRNYRGRTSESLKRIASLAPNLRSGSARIHLLSEIFRHAQPKIPADAAKDMITLFESGTLDEKIFKTKEAITYSKIKLDIGTIIHAAALYENSELLLKTGITKTPQKLDDKDFIEDNSNDLLVQLANDADTSGLARLTRRLMAAVHLPMHSTGSGEQAFGGVSDISNRGNFDKLILSELAYDDDSLIARLVNNEALYLKHEEPPIQLDRKRIILLDSTIRMWGLPRVFAVAAALTCCLNKRDEISVKGYSLSGKNHEAVDLASKEGVVQALSKLDHHLDCLPALLDFLKAIKDFNDSEVILVTNESFLNNKTFIKNQQEIQSKLSYLLTIERGGTLQFHQMGTGRRRLLNHSQYDLDEILFPPEMKLKRTQTAPPSFIGVNPAPLAAPAIGIVFNGQRTFKADNNWVLAVTDDQRVLLWTSRNKAAREITPLIEEGKYAFGEGSEDLYLIAYNYTKNNGFIKFYKISIDSLEVMSANFSQRIIPLSIIYTFDEFYIQGYDQYGVVYWDNDEYAHFQEVDEKDINPEIFEQSDYPTSPDKSVRRIINNGYSTLRRVYRISVTENGQLALDGLELQVFHGNLKFIQGHQIKKQHSLASISSTEENSLAENPGLKLRTYTFDDGSQAIIDFRGYLHLRSADAQIPEITIVLVLEKITAAWSSDGKVSGNPYFIMDNTGNKILAPAVFHERYIQRFINHIIRGN